MIQGGGYNVLAIDLEGTEACDWLTSEGITCVLLKYRVPCVKIGPYLDCPTALQEVTTIGMMRSESENATSAIARRKLSSAASRVLGRRW